MNMRDMTIAVFSFSGHQYLLSHCLRSIYSNAPEHREIVLVWDDFLDWYPIDFDQLRQTTGVDFRLVRQSEIYHWPESIVRWGWIKQQLAKLFCWRYCPDQFVWIVDGDVVLTGDPELFDQAVPILRCDGIGEVPDDFKYFMRKYLDIHEFHSSTFVGSTALFETDVCRQINELCRQKQGEDLVQTVDKMLMSGGYPELPFSEFEIYGHYVHQQGETSLRLKNWNHTHWENNWHLPIQIAWASRDHNLEKRFQNLIQRKSPTVDT